MPTPFLSGPTRREVVLPGCENRAGHRPSHGQSCMGNENIIPEARPERVITTDIWIKALIPIERQTVNLCFKWCLNWKKRAGRYVKRYETVCEKSCSEIAFENFLSTNLRMHFRFQNNVAQSKIVCWRKHSNFVFVCLNNRAFCACRLLAGDNK